MNDFLQGSVVYGDINTPETHFSVKYDNIPHNQVVQYKHYFKWMDDGKNEEAITLDKFASDPNSLWELLEVVLH